MSLQAEHDALRALEHSADDSTKRTTLRIRRDILRTAIMAKEGIDLDGWDKDNPTPTRRDNLPDLQDPAWQEPGWVPGHSIMQSLRRASSPQICKHCRDALTPTPEEFYCTKCAIEKRLAKVDNSWDE